MITEGTADHPSLRLIPGVISPPAGTPLTVVRVDHRTRLPPRHLRPEHLGPGHGAQMIRPWIYAAILIHLTGNMGVALLGIAGAIPTPAAIGCIIAALLAVLGCLALDHRSRWAR